MNGYIDLHCHYLPGVDDGVRTLEQSVDLLSGLRGLGFERVVATPHIRTGMFNNTPVGLKEAYQAFLPSVAAHELPELGLAAEHLFDDVFWQLFLERETLSYPGGHSVLVEFNYENWPLRVEDRFFELQVAGLRPVLAHPERYSRLFRSTDPLDPLLNVGALALLDLMSLVGRYGRRAQRAAERMLEEGVYYAACTDSHRPKDVDLVGEALDRLVSLVGREEFQELMVDNPAHILAGTAEP